MYIAQPETGFVLQMKPNGWHVSSVESCVVTECPVEPGDVIKAVDNVRFDDAMADRRLMPFTKRSGESVVLELERNSETLLVTWTMPPVVLLPRLFILLYIGPFVLAAWFVYFRIDATAAANQRGRTLLILAFLLYALFLVTGVMSPRLVFYSSLIMHAAAWIQMAVMLDVHWELPTPLAEQRTARLVLYMSVFALAFLELVQALPRQAFYLAILFQVLGTTLLLFWRIARDTAVRPSAIMLIGNVFSWLPGLVWLVYTGYAGGSGFMFTLFVSVSMLVWPVFYLYANYRSAIGNLERVGRQGVVFLGFGTLGMFALVILSFTVGQFRGWSPTAVVANSFVAVLILLAVSALYGRFEKLVSFLLYGRIDSVIDQMSRRMASELTRLSDIDAMKEYIVDFCQKMGIERTAVYAWQDNRFEMLLSYGVNEVEDVSHLGDQPRSVPEGLGKPEWVRMSLPLLVGGKVCGYWLCGRRQEDDFYSTDHLLKMQYIVGGLAASLEIHRQRETLEKQLETLLTQERMAALGRMAASLAHQINNPLQLIVGSLEAYGGYGSPGLESPLLRQALDKALYLGEVVKSITLFVRPGTHSATIDVNDTVYKAIMLAGKRINEKHIEVALSLGAGATGRMSSPSDLIQVLTNVIDNACDAMDTNGRLSIETVSNGVYSVIRVRDNGCGMTEFQRRRMPEPFFTTKEHGTGFGMTVAYSIIERSSGKINVESTVGEGTLFEIFIPKQ